MRDYEPAHLWRHIVGETVWGRRGLVKTTSLWLPLALVLSTLRTPPDRDTCLRSLHVFVAAACWCLASILSNDVADRQADRAAGKERWIGRLPAGAGALVVTALWGAGVSSLLPGASAAALAAYAAALVLGLSYSLRPVRFKARGIWGPLAYSASGTLAFAVAPWAFLGSSWSTLAVVAPAVLLDKWVNIHFHQVSDCASDRDSGIRTYAVDVGPERARRSLRWAAGAASGWLVGTLAFVAARLPPWGIVVAAAGLLTVLAAGAYAGVMRRQPERTSVLLKELPWPYLGLTYAVFRVAPLLLLARLAAQERTLWPLLAVAGLSLAVESWHASRYECV
jgi:4-hydroxybenzoate polyprenyltransferase